MLCCLLHFVLRRPSRVHYLLLVGELTVLESVSSHNCITTEAWN